MTRTSTDEGRQQMLDRADTDPREPDRLWKTHVYSAWALAKLVVPKMREAATDERIGALMTGAA